VAARGVAPRLGLEMYRVGDQRHAAEGEWTTTVRGDWLPFVARLRETGWCLPAKAEEAARILEEQGHLAQVRREDNELLIDEFSCPFPKVAHQDRAICALHVDFVSTLTGSDTRLGQSLMRGDPACTYRLRPTSGFSH